MLFSSDLWNNMMVLAIESWRCQSVRGSVAASSSTRLLLL